MYIVPIAWLYVALMMSVAEATNSNGTVLGGIVTFILYGILPTAIIVYIMGTPQRKKARLALEQTEMAAKQVAELKAQGLDIELVQRTEVRQVPARATDPAIVRDPADRARHLDRHLARRRPHRPRRRTAGRRRPARPGSVCASAHAFRLSRAETRGGRPDRRPACGYQNLYLTDAWKLRGSSGRTFCEP